MQSCDSPVVASSWHAAPALSAVASHAPPTQRGHGCVAFEVMVTVAWSGRSPRYVPSFTSSAPLAAPVKVRPTHDDSGPTSRGKGAPNGQPALEQRRAPQLAGTPTTSPSTTAKSVVEPGGVGDGATTELPPPSAMSPQ